MAPKNKIPQRMVSLFAGIGGFELGFNSIGTRTILMCEIDNVAKHVLSTNFPNIPIVDDICTLKSLPPKTDLLCAGFPCQDLSSVGIKKGLEGTRSSLVNEVFRLLNKRKVEWVIFENVSFMLSLKGGEAIKCIVENLEKLGYKWAYRLIDSISFIPQHRKRVYVVASLHYNPCDILLSGESAIQYGEINLDNFEKPLGFYWTEGRSALGLVSDAIPTLKAGSTIGIPSPPAIAFPSGKVAMPDIRDAERLQGFPPDWTMPAERVAKPSTRWKLVGNAVTVNTIAWIAKKFVHPEKYDATKDKPLDDKKWPHAAWGVNGKRFCSNASVLPETARNSGLEEFIEFPMKDLSLRASKGFYSRLQEGCLKRPNYFNITLVKYIKNKENE